MCRSCLKRIFLLFAWLLASPVWALDSDRQQPIQIEADRLDVDDAKGIGVYRGDVRYTQGTLELKAAEVMIYSTQERSLARVVAVGNPATFEQQIDPAGGVLTGEAQTIEYNVTTEQLLLKGSAHLVYCGDEFASDHIEFLAAKDLVKAGKSPQGGGRVQVTIQPRVRDQSGKLTQSPCRRLNVAP